MAVLIKTFVIALLISISFQSKGLSDLDWGVIERSEYAAIINVDPKEIDFDKELGHVHVGYIENVFKGEIIKNAVFIEVNDWMQKRLHEWGYVANSHNYLIFGKSPTDYKGGKYFAKSKYFIKENKLGAEALFKIIQRKTLKKELEFHEANKTHKSLHSQITIRYDSSGNLEDIEVADSEIKDAVESVAKSTVPKFQNSLKNALIKIPLTIEPISKHQQDNLHLKSLINKWKKEKENAKKPKQ